MIITLKFDFVNGDHKSSEEKEFDLESGIQDSVDEAVQVTLDELGKGWELRGYEDVYVEGFKESWTLSDFTNLEDFAEFAGRVEEHGEAYEFRADDIGDTDFDFEDVYNGCWDSVEDFTQDLVEDCYDLKIPNYICVDWELTARDVMMDFSEYHGNDGIHIFRDC